MRATPSRSRRRRAAPRRGCPRAAAVPTGPPGARLPGRRTARRAGRNRRAEGHGASDAFALPAQAGSTAPRVPAGRSRSHRAPWREAAGTADRPTSGKEPPGGGARCGRRLRAPGAGGQHRAEGARGPQPFPPGPLARGCRDGGPPDEREGAAGRRGAVPDEATRPQTLSRGLPRHGPAAGAEQHRTGDDPRAAGTLTPAIPAPAGRTADRPAWAGRRSSPRGPSTWPGRRPEPARDGGDAGSSARGRGDVRNRHRAAAAPGPE